MFAKEVPNETENDLRTYQIVYRTALRETVTEWRRDRQSRQLPKDDHRIVLNGGRRNLVLLGLNMRIIGSPLPKAPTGMFTKRLTELDAERPYRRPLSLLSGCQRGINTATDEYGDVVRVTGCKRYQDRPTKLCTRIWRAQTRLHIYVV